MASDTPLTDGYAVMAQDMDATDYVVPAQLARALERDLNALKSKAIRSVPARCECVCRDDCAEAGECLRAMGVLK